MDYIRPRLPDLALGSSRLAYPVPRLLFLSTPAIADLQSFASHLVASPGAPPRHCTIVFDPTSHARRMFPGSLRIGILCNLFPTAPLGDVHIRSSHVSCGGLDLRAETSMTHRLHRTLHDPQRNPRSTPRGRCDKVHLVKGACSGLWNFPMSAISACLRSGSKQRFVTHCTWPEGISRGSK